VKDNPFRIRWSADRDFIRPVYPKVPRQTDTLGDWAFALFWLFFVAVLALIIAHYGGPKS